MRFSCVQSDPNLKRFQWKLKHNCVSKTRNHFSKWNDLMRRNLKVQKINTRTNSTKSNIMPMLSALLCDMQNKLIHVLDVFWNSPNQCVGTMWNKEKNNIEWKWHFEIEKKQKNCNSNIDDYALTTWYSLNIGIMLIHSFVCESAHFFFYFNVMIILFPNQTIKKLRKWK